MDCLCQILEDTLCNKIQRALEPHMEALQVYMHDLKDSWRKYKASIQEEYIMEDIMAEYNQEMYAWYDFGVDCSDWYRCHFWDDNHFHLLFDDYSTSCRGHPEEYNRTFPTYYSSILLFIGSSG